MQNAKDTPSGEPQVKPRPKVVCSWNGPGRKWDIEILDEEGKKQITPLQQNQLLKQLRMSLNRRKRHLGVRRYAQREQLASPVKESVNATS